MNLLCLALLLYAAFWFWLALTDKGAGVIGGSPTDLPENAIWLSKISGDPKFENIRAHQKDN